MQTSNASQGSRSKDIEWYLLGEYSLSKFLSEHEKEGELMAALLSRTMQDLDIPLEYLENIDRMLTGFAKEALVHFKQVGLELPGYIRVFCQKKVLDNANSGKTAEPVHAGQVMEYTPIKFPSSMKMTGGWGYFIIERSGNDAGSSEGIHPFIDLYLYKEGE